MKQIILCLAISIFVIAPACATEKISDTVPNTATAPPAPIDVNSTQEVADTVILRKTKLDKNFYALADIGLLVYSNTASIYDNGDFPNPGALSFGGGYRLNSNFNVEAKYSYISDSSLNSSSTIILTEKLSASSFDVAAVGVYPIDNDSDIFVKLGLAYTRLQYSFSSATFTPSSGSGNGSKTNLMFGIGLQNNFDKLYSIRLQFEYFGNTTLNESFNNGSTKTYNVGASLISAGGLYYF